MGALAAQSFGVLTAQILIAAVVALLGALIVQYSAQFVNKHKPGYGAAWGAAFLGYAGSLIVRLVFDLTDGIPGNGLDRAENVIVIMASFFVQAFIYTRLLGSDHNTPMRFHKACIISVVQLIIIGLVVVLGNSFLVRR